MYKPPKAIASHPGVAECNYGPDSGVDEYKHEVWLKSGWHFARGRNAGGRGGHYNSVKRFLGDKPTEGKGPREKESQS